MKTERGIWKFIKIEIIQFKIEVIERFCGDMFCWFS